MEGVWPDDEKACEVPTHVEEKEDILDELSTKISLHEIAGAANPQTMQMIGQLQHWSILGQFQS